MDNANRLKTFLTIKLQINITQSNLNQIKKYLHQNYQQDETYLIMAMNWRNMRFEISPTWTCSDQILVVKPSPAPDLLLHSCYEALDMNWHLNWSGSSWNSNFHVHVHVLKVHESWSISSIQALILHQSHKINQNMQ